MFCQYCGNPIVDDARFCPKCGKAVPTKQPSSSPAGPIFVICQGCGSELEIDPSYAGKSLQCPGCGSTVSVPAEASGSDREKKSSSATAAESPPPISPPAINPAFVSAQKTAGPRCKHCGSLVPVGVNPCPKCGREIKWTRKVVYGAKTKTLEASSSGPARLLSGKTTPRKPKTTNGTSFYSAMGDKSKPSGIFLAIKLLWLAFLVPFVLVIYKVHQFYGWEEAWNQSPVVFLVAAGILALIGILGDVVLFKKDGTDALIKNCGALGVLTVLWSVVFSIAAVLAVGLFGYSWKKGKEMEKNAPVYGERICPSCKQKVVIWEIGEKCPNCGHVF